jgi:menaquinone-dependent protoporphyrinogen oxidase
MKTLIVYASKYGCTEDCAKTLAEKITGKVELHNLKEKRVVDLSSYDIVIIGSSIYVGKVKKEVNKFCSEHLEQLKKKKLGLYLCCMHTGDIAQNQLNNAFPQELSTVAVAKDYFGGEFRFNKMNFMEKFVVKRVAESDKNLPNIDTKQNISSISQEKINSFAQLINS